eukprot:Gb_13611 [translate_table: standard]
MQNNIVGLCIRANTFLLHLFDNTICLLEFSHSAKGTNQGIISRGFGNTTIFLHLGKNCQGLINTLISTMRMNQNSISIGGWSAPSTFHCIQ